MAKQILGKEKPKKSKKRKGSSSSDEDNKEPEEEELTPDAIDEQLLIQLSLKGKGIRLKNCVSYDTMTCAARPQRKSLIRAEK